MGDTQHKTMTGGAINWLLRKIKGKGETPILTVSEEKNLYRATLRFPDTKTQISWISYMVYVNIQTAWGNVYVNETAIAPGDWNQPFFGDVVAVPTIAPSADGAPCWLTTIGNASRTSAGRYFLTRGTVDKTNRDFYVNVVAFGKYE